MPWSLQGLTVFTVSSTRIYCADSFFAGAGYIPDFMT